jgi:ADP-ribose pyrophosphatase
MGRFQGMEVTPNGEDSAGPCSMRHAKLLETEVIVPKPKRFVREALVMPDGYGIDWYYIDTPASVMIVPVTSAGDLVLVRQYRHNLKRDTLELPAGTLDKGEQPDEAAMRELEEETGYVMASGFSASPIGNFYSLPSETNRYTHFFLAKPVVRVGTPAGDTVIEKYFDMTVVEMPLQEAFSEIGKSISGIETAGALMLAREYMTA